MTSSSPIPPNVAFIAVAIQRQGGLATLREIYREVQKINPEWKEQYKNEESFEGTVRGTIESHCPQSDNFSHPGLPIFEWMDAGKYRVVPPAEWDAALERRKRLGGRRQR